MTIDTMTIDSMPQTEFTPAFLTFARTIGLPLPPVKSTISPLQSESIRPCPVPWAPPKPRGSKANAPGDAELGEQTNFARQRDGSSFTIGWPDEKRRAGKLDNRLLWTPRGVPDAQTVALVSSRLGKEPANYPGVFAGIRTRLAHLGDNEVVVTGERMALDPFVRRAAEWFRCQLIALRWLPPKPTEQWWRDATSDLEDRVWPVYLSPFHVWVREGDDDDCDLPLDDFVFELSDHVYVLWARQAGHVSRLVDERLQSAPTPPTFIMSAHSHSLYRKWLQRGAVNWHLMGNQQAEIEIAIDGHPPTGGRTAMRGQTAKSTPARSFRFPRFHEYLVHCTRAQSLGANNQEPNYALIDQLLFPWRESAQEPEYPHPLSAFGTLMAIVSQQRLLGQRRSYRGQYPCISFTAVPLPELLQRRQYRPHRFRWDYEPYGIAIRQTELRRLGAKPVIYGGEWVWDSLSDLERPYFQKRYSRDGDVDWSEECEWRLMGDLDLQRIAADDAFVFVAEEAERRIAQPLSRWPVFSLESLTRIGEIRSS